jgi:hypothetical protein
VFTLPTPPVKFVKDRVNKHGKTIRGFVQRGFVLSEPEPEKAIWCENPLIWTEKNPNRKKAGKRGEKGSGSAVPDWYLSIAANIPNHSDYASIIAFRNGAELRSFLLNTNFILDMFKEDLHSRAGKIMIFFLIASWRGSLALHDFFVDKVFDF